MSDSKGFSLIELLMILLIIGILSASAITQFKFYKSKAYTALLVSDIKNMITAQEAGYADTDQYKACSNTTIPCETVLPGFKPSRGVKVTSVLPAGPAFGYPWGSDKKWGNYFGVGACHKNAPFPVNWTNCWRTFAKHAQWPEVCDVEAPVWAVEHMTTGLDGVLNTNRCTEPIY